MTSPTAPEPTLMNGNGHSHYAQDTEIEKLLRQIAALSQDKEELERKRYVDANLARFAEIMRWRVEYTLETWADQLLMELVPFVGGLHASFYVLLEAPDAAERNLTWIGGYACPEDVKKTIPLGSGLTGQVGKTGEPIYLDDPNTFQSNTFSSLSTLRSQAFLIQPLVHNEVVEGVLEITALQAFKPEQRELIEILCGQLAANLSTIKNQVRIQKLYQEAQEKSEMLAAQEEEMRQNVEELEATQEEMRRIQQNIEVQRKQLAAIISSTNDNILAIDQHYNVTAFNEAQARYYEQQGIELERGANLATLMGDGWQTLKASMDRALNGETFTQELEQETPTGRIYYSIAFNPIKVNGEVVGACYFAKDISEAREAQEMMKQANEELAAQGEELRQNLEELEATQEEMRRTQAMAQEQKAQIDALLDSSEDMIVMVDTDYNLVIANKKVRDDYRQNAGIDPEPGMSVFQLFPPEQLEYYKALYDRALAGESFVEPVHFVGMGMEFYFEVSYFPVQFLGRTIGAASMARDVTAAKQAEAEMNALQARLSQVAANAPGFIFQLTVNPETLETRFTYASPRSQEMFGYSPEFFYDLTFEQALQLVHPLDQEKFRQSFIGGVQMGDQILWEGRLIHKNGHTLNIRMEANSTPNDDGTLSANGMMVDIAEEIAERVRRTQQEQGLSALAKSTTIASGNFGQALEEMTRVLAESLNVQQAGVWFLMRNGNSIVSAKVYNAETGYSQGLELNRKDFGPYFEAIDTGEVIAADDAHQHPATSCFGESYLTPLGIGAMLDVPIRRAGKLLGVICIEHVGPARRWHEDEIRFASSVSELVTLALEARDRQELMAEMDSQRAKIEGLLDANTDIILLLDEDYRLALMNKAMRAAFTIDGREPALGDDVFNYLPPADHATYLERCKRAFAGESFSVENQFVYQGIKTTQQIKYFPIREGDQIKYIAIVATDISARKQQEARIRQANEELKAQEEELRQNLEELEATQEEVRRQVQKTLEQKMFIDSSIDSMRSMFIATDENGIILHWNEAATRHLGYSREEILHKQTPAIFHDPYEVVAECQRLNEVYQANLELGYDVFKYLPYRGEKYEREWTYIRKDGTRFPVNLSISGWKRADGSYGGLLGIATDITEQKAQEAALREAQEKMSQVEQNLPGVLFQFCFDKTDGSAGFNFVSQQVEAFFGYTKEEWLSFGAAEIGGLFHPDSVAEFQTKLMAAVMELKPFQMNAQLRRKDGSYFWASIEARTRDIGNNRTSAEGLITDNSQQIALLQELQAQSALISSLINSTTDTILMLDRQYRIVMMNDQMRSSYAAQGIEAKIGDDVFTFLPPDQHAWYRSNYERALAGENFTVDVHYEYMGMNIYYSINKYPVMQNGEAVGIAIVARDVTALKLQQQDLELKNSLFAHWEEPIWVFDQGKVTDVNAASVKLFRGKRPEDFVGKTLDHFSPPTQPDGRNSDEAAREYIGQALQTGKATFDWTYQDLKGKPLPCTVTLRTFPNADRQAVAAILSPKSPTKK